MYDISGEPAGSFAAKQYGTGEYLRVPLLFCALYDIMNAKHFMRAFALLIALSFLPLFLSSNNIRGADSSRFGSLYPDTRIVTNNILSLPVAAYTEELLPISQSRITSAHSVRRFDRPQPFSIYFNGGLVLLQISLQEVSDIIRKKDM